MQGKTVLVTGGARRVGAAIVRHLHMAGANVAIHCHASLSDATALRAELNEKRADSACVVRADLLDVPALPQVIEETLKQFGHLDAIVNNASSFYPTPLDKMGEQQWDDLLGTNMKAPLFLAQAAIPELRRRHGCIVNIIDIHADFPMQGHLLYNVAKSGLAALTRALAQELAPQIRVNGISPGVNLWPENEAWHDEEQRRRIIAHTLLKREGKPEDIASTVKFLIADAPYITGQVIAVDGGRSINL